MANVRPNVTSCNQDHHLTTGRNLGCYLTVNVTRVPESCFGLVRNPAAAAAALLMLNPSNPPICARWAGCPECALHCGTSDAYWLTAEFVFVSLLLHFVQCWYVNRRLQEFEGVCKSSEGLTQCRGLK